MNIKQFRFKTWFWYIIAGVVAAVSYPYVVDILSQQFTVYQIHRGYPGSYIVVFALWGWYSHGLSIKLWGKFGVKGEALLIGGLIALTLILHYAFGYQFFW